MAVYTFQYSNLSENDERQSVMGTIDRLRSGDSFQDFKNKFILEQNLVDTEGKITVTDDELKKIYITYNFTDSVINKIVSYCPNLEVVKTRDNDKRKLIKHALNEIDWKAIENENYDTLESKGDTFFEIYFDDFEDTIPKLRVLDSRKMQRALLDDKNRYNQYIYKERVEDAVASYTTGNVTTTNSRDRVIVFERGRKVIFDPIMEDGTEILTEEGNIAYDVKIIENRDSYKDEFPLIHIKGNKRQRDEFSRIPAESYIDPSLLLDQITSDLRQINRALGYPFIMIIDGVPVAGARRTPAGIFGVQSTLENSEKQAQVKDVQISNNLQSIFSEFKVARDDLYDKAGLISPTLLEKLNIDSSRVIMQLNLPSENKIELYVDNTIKAMQVWFKILLKENDMYDEGTDKNLSFMKPKFLIKSSPFDELLYEQSEVKSTKKSREEIYIENMMLDEEIKIKKEEINEEIGDENKDKSFMKKEVDNRVANGQNVDNNMINK